MKYQPPVYTHSEVIALQMKWEAVEDKLKDELSATKEKLEASEKRIRESQEQEPTVFVFPAIQDGYYNICNRGGAGQIPLYTIPPIPTELAELQRENAELRKQLALANEYILASS